MPQLFKEQHSERWHLERNKRLTASNVAAALGLCPHKTAEKLYRELIGEAPRFTGNVATQWGTDHESDALADFEAVTGRLVIPGGFWTHPSITWLGASPDGLLGDHELVQTKAPYSQRIPDEPPEHYRVQCIAELEVTGRDVNHLHFWTPRMSHTFRIERNRELWADWYPQLELFWQRVLEKAWPSTKPTRSRSTSTTSKATTSGPTDAAP